MFSFQPWHSAIEMRRYLRRFIHLFPGFERIEGVLRTRYNQHNSIIVPMLRWLAERGVQFRTGARVTDVLIVSMGATRRVSRLIINEDSHLQIAPEDQVYLTLGSMTDGSALGSNTSPPSKSYGERGASRLWRNLASRYADFGHPEKFCGTGDNAGWVFVHAESPQPGVPRFHGALHG